MEVQDQSNRNGFHEKQDYSRSRHSVRKLVSNSSCFGMHSRRRSFENIYCEDDSKEYQEVRRIKGLGWLVRIVDRSPSTLLVHLMNGMPIIFCVIATSLDFLFCYIFLVDKAKKCVGFDDKLRTIAVIFRSITDFLYTILILRHIRCNAIDVDDDGVRRIAWRFFLSYFILDLLAVLPLPQVLVLILIPSFKGHTFMRAVRSLKYILLIQYFPRVFRIYSHLTKLRSPDNVFLQTAGAKAAFNLFLYMLASHFTGAFWYLFTIERRTTCWQEWCQHCPLNCNYVVANPSSDDTFCSAEAENYAGSKTATFDFGMYKDALPIVESTDFIRKISYCYWWGLQKLSSLGQDLKTSDRLWEIYFAVTITISGLVSFALFIGNLQTHLQKSISRFDEMRLKWQDTELWMEYHSLPPQLRKKIKKHERYTWRETKGFHFHHLLHSLHSISTHVSKITIRYLCRTPLSNVPKLQNMNNPRLVDAICDYLKPVVYNERNFIVEEGEPLDKMVFIIQGKVKMYSKSNNNYNIAGSSKWLNKGDFYGEDLLDWALKDPNSTVLPISTKNIRAHSKVEAFLLNSNDLKTVVSKFWWLFTKNTPSLRPIWAPWAALALQLAWHQYYQNKENKIKNKSHLSIVGSSSISSSRSDPHHHLDSPLLITSTYILRALRACKLKPKKTQPQEESSSV